MKKAIWAVCLLLPKELKATYREAWLSDCKFLKPYGISKFSFLTGLIATVVSIYLRRPKYMIFRMIALAIAGMTAFLLVKQGLLDSGSLVLVLSLGMGLVFRKTNKHLSRGLFAVGLAETFSYLMLATYPLRFISGGTRPPLETQTGWVLENVFWIVALGCFTGIALGAISLTLWTLTGKTKAYLTTLCIWIVSSFWLARWGVLVSSPQSDRFPNWWVGEFYKWAVVSCYRLQMWIPYVCAIGYVALLWRYLRSSKQSVVL